MLLSFGACVVAVVAELILPSSCPANVVPVYVPLIVTSLGNPIVTSWALTVTVVSLAVWVNVKVWLSKSTLELLVPSVISKSWAVTNPSTYPLEAASVLATGVAGMVTWPPKLLWPVPETVNFPVTVCPSIV